MTIAPQVSIVIPTLGRPDVLQRCLDAIEATVRCSFETICVTESDDDSTRDVLASRRVRVIAQHGRQGFVKAANAGFRAATGEWLLQLNDDCRLLPHAVTNAINFLSAPRHAHIGQAAFFHNTPTLRNVQQEISLDGQTFRVHHVRGLCFANFGLVRRSLAAELGFYDERFHMYAADPDFSLKIWHQARLEVSPCAGALVEHDELVDERAAIERSRQSVDNDLLFAKWGL